MVNCVKALFSVILIILVDYVPHTESILCYKCIFAPYTYVTNFTNLCKDFDYSEKFIVDCPYSTFCMKKNTHAKIDRVQINGTERDCAFQKLDTQNYINGKWRPEILVEEPYTEGCQKVEDKGFRTAFIEHCYCKGELCNGARSITTSGSWGYRTLVLSVLLGYFWL